ncbi:hypothetical protein MTP03_05790 [Tsukamurella sp. PLM1]|nr:hypothetical protein MTP03_05790 [Tsukamurella sp. PLM1]
MGTQFRELLAPAGGRDRDPVHVRLDVEGLVLHPYGVIEVDDRIVQLAAERGHGGDAAGKLGPQVLEPVSALDGAGVQLEDAAHVHQLGARLQVQEGGVQPAESFHWSCPQCIRR